MSKKKLYLLYLSGCIISILIGLLMLIHVHKVTNILNTRGVATIATVTKIDEFLDYNDDLVRKINFEFYDILNQLQTAIIYDGSENIGDKVEIIYDPHDPKKIIRSGGSYKSSAVPYTIITLLGIIVIFIIILFEFLTLLKKKRYKYKSLMNFI